MFTIIYYNGSAIRRLVVNDAEELHRVLRALATVRRAEILEVAAA